MSAALSLAAPRPLAAPAPAPRARTAPDGALSPLERTVIQVAAADARRGPPLSDRALRLRRIVDLLLGRRPVRPLADPRLEALRRFAMRAALGRDRIGDMRSLRDAGFTLAQIVVASRLSRAV